MSLRTFHLIFIACSVILAAWFGYWAIDNFQQQQGVVYLWTGVGSFLFTASLVVYEFLFLKKVRA